MTRVSVLLCVILLVPLALVDVPPLLDYPNHLARAVVLATGASDPILSRMYAANWAVIPNLGVDLVLPPLLHILPVHVAGRVVVGFAVLLPVLGTIAYSRMTFGVRAVWPLASVLVAYNATLLLGFLNFTASLGMALLLAAAWVAWRDRHPRRMLALAAAGSVVLFFCHLMGLLFFYVLIAGYELERLWRTRPAVVATRFANTAPVVAVPLALYLISPLAPRTDGTEFSSFIDKGRELVLPFSNYILPLDIATATAVGVFLLACIAARRCRITLGSGLTIVLTIILFLAAPWSFKGTFFVDTRFVIMLGFLLFGALLPSGLPRPFAASAIVAFGILFVIRMVVVSYAWHEHTHDLADMRAVIARVEPGSRVLVTGITPEDAPQYWQTVPLSRRLSFGFHMNDHLPALLLIEHRAYWPFLFDNPSQQPVVTLPPYRELAERADLIPDYRAMDVAGTADLCGYDNLLLLNSGGEPDLAHYARDRLALVGQADIAALFRVKQAACSSGTRPQSH